MLNKTLGFLLLCFLSSFVQAQQIQRCHTTEYVAQMEQNDPGFTLRAADIEAEVNRYLSLNKDLRVTDEDILYIPVVFHVVYNVPAENISDDQIFAQIDVLNEDFRRLNEDASDTPDEFSDVAADSYIQFQLAGIDPDGNPTNGITRTETDIASWNLFAPITDDNYAEKVKETDKGGQDIWDRDCYLNIWVCDLGNTILGYASPPGSLASKDGVVIGYKWLGRGGSAVPPYNQGRTTTHEVGHWLGLRHIWGDDGGNCAGSDGIADTPNQAEETYSCPSFPQTDACSPTPPGIMFMNYMDYVNDACMNLFTQGQANKMRSILQGSRSEIIACSDLVTVDNPTTSTGELVIYPNPASDLVTFPLDRLDTAGATISIYNLAGQEVLNTYSNGDLIVQLNVSGLPAGTYIVRAFDGSKSMRGKIIISR